jgi:FKBP-type peptidyl-prolyl cis-trans isomerase FklB
MRALVSLSLIALLSVPALAQAPQQPRAARPDSAAPGTGAASYSIGYRMGAGFKRQGAPIDLQAFMKGLQEGVAGQKPAMSEQQMDQALEALQKDVAARLPEKNRQEGEAFLAGNARQPGVKTTKSGLQYKVLKPGSGKPPAKTDTVKVHYRGTLLDGTTFDSSYERGEPVTFAVEKVIPGWTEALQMMQVGSKWQLFIPSELAYGKDGYPPAIAPNSTLVFDVELLGIGE